MTSVVPLCLRSKDRRSKAGNGAKRRALAGKPLKRAPPGWWGLLQALRKLSANDLRSLLCRGQRPVPFTGFQHEIIIFSEKALVKGNFPGYSGRAGSRMGVGSKKCLLMRSG